MVHQLTFCEDSEVWSFFESWFTPFSRCFEWTILCYTPFIYLIIGTCVWIYLTYSQPYVGRPPRKRLSVWSPLQFTRSSLAAALMLVFFMASIFGEIKFYRALYAEYRGERVSVHVGLNTTEHFVPMASIVYDIVNWLSCIVIHILHYLHRDIGRQTSQILISYWSLMAVFHLPAYYRTWMDLFHPKVYTSMSTKSVVLHTVTYPLMLASLAMNIVMKRKRILLSHYENIPGYNRRRSMTR